jgi:hypothetical protein
MQNVTNASALRACITYSLVLLRTLVGTLPLNYGFLTTLYRVVLHLTSLAPSPPSALVMLFCIRGAGC